jgi:hypothetical protein
VKLPVSEEPLGSGKTDVARSCWSVSGCQRSSNSISTGGLVAVGQSRPRGDLLEGILAAGLSCDLGERLTWRPTPDVALDASAVTSLRRGPDWVLRGGVSVRFGR